MRAASPMEPRPAITLNRVVVRRGGTVITDGLDLRVTAGLIFWITGPNGAGKTSLLRVIAGLDSPASGTVAREGHGGGRFLYYHAEMALPAWSTVGAWERLVSRLPGAAGASPTALRPDVPATRTIRRLSTGERKRLLLDALLRAPGSLLLDEPYEHLSPGAKSGLTELLERRAERSVVVVVTNQASGRIGRDAGIRLEGGVATRLPAEPGAEAG